MKTLFIKDFNLFFSDRKTIVLTFVVPIILVTVFSVAFSGLRSDNRKAAPMATIKMGILDDDKSVASQTIIGELEKADALKVFQADSTKLYEAVAKGKLIGVLHIHKGFLESYMGQSKQLAWEFNYQEGADFEVKMFRSVFEPMMAKIGQQYSPSTQECASAAFTLPFKPKGPQPGTVVQAYNDPWLVQPVIGIAIILMLFNTINIGGHLIDEFSNKTLNRLLLSPTSYRAFVSSKFTLTFLVCVLQLAIILLYAKVVLGLYLFNLPVIALIVVLASFACAAFCLFMAGLCRTRNQLNGISIGTILFLSAMGGSMMPRFIMPEVMQQFSQFSINYWVLEAFYDVLWRRSDFFPLVFTDAAIIIAIGLVLLSLSAIVFRQRLKLI